MLTSSIHASDAMSWLVLWLGYLFCSIVHSERVTRDSCQLSDALLSEIKSYKNFADSIVSEVTNGSYASVFYNDLTQFTDKFGYRKSGTEALELSIKELSNDLSKKDLAIKLENVTVPIWLRGKEMAFYITSFRKKRLRIMALGGSSSGNVTAPLMIVKDLEDLDRRKDKAAGKIVLFNTEFENYETTVKSRNEGPAKASQYKAVGALVRSVTPFSIGTIHVGVTDFGKEKPIPAAAISLEDADVLFRLAKKEDVKIQLIILNKEESGYNISRNLIADIPGKSKPQSYMTLSGHIDSWDVGQGALDDGGGAFLAIHALLLLKHMGIEPAKRTLRAILWTGEEMGLYGAKAYAEAHSQELQNWTAGFESDEGLFEPLGFKINANTEASCILKEILSLFISLNATEVEKTNKTISSDISVFVPFNVPLLVPLMKPNNYFWYHHSEGDSMRVMDSHLMDKHLALTAGIAYILADLENPLPRNSPGQSASAAEGGKLVEPHH